MGINNLCSFPWRLLSKLNRWNIVHWRALLLQRQMLNETNVDGRTAAKEQQTNIITVKGTLPPHTPELAGHGLGIYTSTSSVICSSSFNKLKV